jgi:AcrR family transcriptional regulator
MGLPKALLCTEPSQRWSDILETSGEASAKKASSKRMGRKDSGTFNALLDAAEFVMREDGYSAITARRVAEMAGLKQQLIYYYFKSVDDLLLETFKRRTERDLNDLAVDVASENPILAIWDKMNSKVDAKLTFEFVALANHHDGVRQEAARYREMSRRMEAAAISRQFKEKGANLGPLTPAAAAFLMYAASLMLTRETSTGVSYGHEDVRDLVDWVIDITT